MKTLSIKQNHSKYVPVKRYITSRIRHKVQRFIRWYEKYGDKLVGELPINKRIRLVYLQKIFNESINDPMYASYQIYPHQKFALEKLLGIHMDLYSYDYFLEANSI